MMRAKLEDIKKAIEECGIGRHQLAEEARVSTSTLRRIVIGEVPTLDGKANPRTRKLWAGSISRLAAVLSADPADWLNAVNLPPDDYRDAFGELPSLLAHDQDDALSQVVDAGKVRAVLSTYLPFHSPGRDDTFFAAYSRTLIAGLDSTWSVELEHWDGIHTEFHPVEDKEVQLHIGLLQTLHRQLDGFRFIPLRGLEVGLSAVVKRSDESLEWADIIDRMLSGRCHCVVLEDEVAGDYLRTVRAIRQVDATIVSVSDLKSDDDAEHSLTVKVIAKKLVAEQDRQIKARSGLLVAFVADQETCRLVIAAASNLVMEVAPSAPSRVQPPRYHVSMAVKSKNSKWYDLLMECQRMFMFRDFEDFTAELYANAFAIVPSLAGVDGLSQAPRSNWKLVHFEEASRRFREMFATKLLVNLMSRYKSEPEIAVDWLLHIMPGEWGREAATAVARVLSEETQTRCFDRTKTAGNALLLGDWLQGENFRSGASSRAQGGTSVNLPQLILDFSETSKSLNSI